MPVIIDYIIKLNICLAVVYLFYQLFLRRLTFYNWNRWYLVGYTALSFIIPLINVMPSLQKQQLQNATIVQWIPVVNFDSSRKIDFFENLSSWDWIIAALALGSLFLLFRLGLRMFAFIKMKAKAKLISEDETRIYQLDEDIAPFSFGNAIFINTDMHEGEELEEIIRHEFVHVKQKHSIDIIWCELLCIVNWFNPFVWLIRHNVRQNLEFLADDKVLQNGLDKKEYQYLLLKVIGNQQFAFTNHFNFSSLKKRIAMMNTMKSAKLHLTRFLFLLPVVAVLLLSFRNEMNERTEQTAFSKLTQQESTTTITQPPINVTFKKQSNNDTTPETKKVDNIVFENIKTDTISKQKPLYIIDGVEITATNEKANSINPDDIKSINVIKDVDAVSLYGNKGRNGVIQINTKRDTIIDGRLQLFNPPLLNPPLYILDGKPVTEAEVKQIDPGHIEEINVLKGANAMSVYGTKAVNGVVDIITKKSREADVLISTQGGQVKLKQGDVELMADSIVIGRQSTGRINSNIDPLEVVKIGYKLNRYELKNLPSEAYYILNGKHASEKQIKKLKEEDIKSIDVLKGDSAVKFYGKKARDGAVVIVTK